VTVETHENSSPRCKGKYGSLLRLVGAAVESLVPGGERARHQLHRSMFAMEGPPRSMTAAPEVPLQRPGGDVIFVKIGLGSIALREGRFVVATITDQTTRHEMHRRTQQVFETSPAVICVWQQRPDGSVCMPFASPSAEALYGVSRAELARSAEVVLRRIHPEDLPRVEESIARSAREMSPWRCEFRLSVPGQPTRWLEGHSMPTREPDGTISWVGSVMDISAQHRAEALIAETRAQLDNALDAARAYTFMLDFVTGEVRHDARAARLFRLPPEALEGYTVADLGKLSHPDDRPLVHAELARVLTGRDTEVALTHRLRCGDGEYVTFSLRGRVERDAEGKALRLYGAGADVTREEQALTALRQSKARFRQLAETIHDVFWLVNHPEKTVEVHPEDQARVLAAVGRSTRLQRGVSHPSPRGALRWIRDQASPCAAPTGR
jgi:PAS domain S-box-containing protein